MCEQEPVSTITDPKEKTVVGILKETFQEDIEPEILQIYEILKQQCPEILRYKTREKDIPVDEYTQRHQEEYKELSNELSKENWEVLVIGSGMFGGKSTLSFFILDKFEEQGYTPIVCMADVMAEDENFVTARSYPGEEEDKIRKAIRYGEKENTNAEFLDQEGPLIVLLDEFSFYENPNTVTKLVDKIRKKNKDRDKNDKIKLILTGLNTNCLGQTLGIFTNLDRYIGEHKEVFCKSFVHTINNEQVGDSTIRYVNIRGKWILDIGILPLIVSKIESMLVHYRSATKEETFAKIFEGYPNILDFILNPTEELVNKQKQRKEQLIESFRGKPLPSH